MRTTKWCELRESLTTETVKGAALALESVDNIEGGDCLALGVLSVGDGVTDDTLEEVLQDTTGLFVDHWRWVSIELMKLWRNDLLAEIRLTPPRRARRLIAGFVIPWMLSRRILRWRLAPPFPRPLPPFPPKERRVSMDHIESDNEVEPMYCCNQVVVLEVEVKPYWSMIKRVKALKHHHQIWRCATAGEATTTTTSR